ncbi:hypothetical protein RB594_003262 [Gaeumannomyces avenae]
MVPDKSRAALLELCTKATLMGNNISVRMLEFLSSVKHQPHGFKNLAQDFLDICRILWAIEAGLSECFRAGQHFPDDMVKELNGKFRQTNADFQVLDHMMVEFLEYENGGVGGKLRKGWRMMFAEKSIAKIRDSLGKSRDSLRMSALVFQWSLGSASPDGSIGSGYSELAAALDRMAKGRPAGRTPKNNDYEATMPGPAPKLGPRLQSDLPRLPALPPTMAPLSQSDDMALIMRDDIERPVLNRRDSMRSRDKDETRSTRSGRSGVGLRVGAENRSLYGDDRDRDRDRTALAHRRFDRRDDREEIPGMPSVTTKLSTALYNNSARRASTSRTASDSGMTAAPSPQIRSMTESANINSRISAREEVASLSNASHVSRSRRVVQEENTSPGLTDSETLLDDMDSLELSFSGPVKAIRLKADPLQMPRWSPRNKSPTGGNASSLRMALISAVQGQKHKMVEQLLDRGVSPETSPDTHVLREAVLNNDPESMLLLLRFSADPNSPDKDGVTPLFSAVESGYIAGASLLLKYGADPNLCAGPEPESPLALAVVDGKFELVQLLLMYGGDANHSLSCGNTALIASIGKTTPKRVVALLLEYGADPDAKNSSGKTALFEAINAGRVDVVQMLLDHGANPNLPGPKHMLWPATMQPACLKLLLARGADTRKAPGILELATSTNSPESVRILIEAGVDVNAKKDGVYTPLCTSIRDDRADLFNMILAAGADPNVPSAEYPCFKCITHFRTQYLPQLIEAGANISSPPGICEMAVKMNNIEGLRWLLDHGGADPNDKNEQGQTALTTAIREGRVEMAQVLLAGGADATVRGEGWPVCMAVKQPDILRHLLPTLPDPRAFRGVMEMAVVANQLASVKLLLAAGVSVEDRNGGVFSPLTTAIREENKQIVLFLLDEGGADVNAPGEHLPIVKAIRRCVTTGSHDIIKLLLERGADINHMYRGWNGVLQAVENGDPVVLRLLIDHAGPRTVDLEARDDDGRTAIDVALGRGFKDAVDILRAAAKAT